MNVWKPEHTKTLEIMVSIGCDDGLIAKQLGFCRETIQRRRSALGLPPYYRVRQGNLRTIFYEEVCLAG